MIADYNYSKLIVFKGDVNTNISLLLNMATFNDDITPWVRLIGLSCYKLYSNNLFIYSSPSIKFICLTNEILRRILIALTITWFV